MSEDDFEIENLLTVKNFAKQVGYSSANIYMLAKRNKLKIIDVDGVKFVDLQMNKEKFKERRKHMMVKRIQSLLKLLSNEK